jgi:AcrR family transcriptional regulator
MSGPAQWALRSIFYSFVEMGKRETTETAILDAAERLFMQHGLAAVTLEQIAKAIDMRHASLYYHAPGGKDDLFVRVVERALARHQAGLTQAIRDAGTDLRAQMHAVARWFCSQPPLDLTHMIRADLPLLDPPIARALEVKIERALRDPLAAAIGQAMTDGALDAHDPEFLAFGMLALLQSVFNIPDVYAPDTQTRIAIAERTVDTLLFGWFKRP